jgi:CBS domain-containing protein
MHCGRVKMKVTYAVKNIMTTDIVSVESDVIVHEALILMTDRNIGSVVVTESRKMVGILTERDVLKKCCPNQQCTVMKAADIMSSPLITIDGDAAIGQAADLMASKKIRRLLVTRGGKIEGIVTERDVMRGTLDVFKTLAESVV